MTNKSICQYGVLESRSHVGQFWILKESYQNELEPINVNNLKTISIIEALKLCFRSYTTRHSFNFHEIYSIKTCPRKRKNLFGLNECHSIDGGFCIDELNKLV